jgi:hypothetical protein
MLFLILFTIISYGAHEGTAEYKECMEINFDMRACQRAKNLYNTGKALCSIQGKGFNGNSDCK